MSSPLPPSPITPHLQSLSVSPQSPPEPAPGPPEPPEDEDPEDPEGSWGVPWSEEEEEGAEPPGGWLPEPPEIRRLYEAIARSGALPLRTPALPRRLPTPEPPGDPQEGADPARGSPQSEPRPEIPPPPTEFDFDDDPLPPNPALIDRRRTPGARGQKREARLDKVLSDMKRHKRLEEQILRTGRDLFPPETPEPPAPKRPPGLLLRQRKY